MAIGRGKYTYKYDRVFHLVDADGTVYNDEYYIYRQVYDEQNTILLSNENLLKAMAGSIKKAPQKGQLSSFSMRQTPELDAPSPGRPSFCDTLKSFHAELNRQTQNRCDLDTYLMGDTCTNSKAGTSFHSRDIHFGKDAPKDHSKISMLYAKMQRIALRYPDSKENHGVFVWDDNDRVLEWLHGFFSARPHLIPMGQTLNLMLISTSDNTSSPFNSSIKGKGKPNPLYQAAVKWYYQGGEFTYFSFKTQDGLPDLDISQIDYYFSPLDGIHQALLSHQVEVDGEIKAIPAISKVSSTSDVKSDSPPYDFVAHLIDADDVVFNSLYHAYKNDLNYSEEQAVCAANHKLIHSIVEDISKVSGGGQIESFSSRQTPHHDHGEAKKHNTSLFCDALSALQKAIQSKTGGRKCEYEKYMMGDVHLASEPSMCFKKKDDAHFGKGTFPVDPAKIAMLYARMQRLAIVRPRQKICVTVWDRSPRVLHLLSQFFSQNPQLIPQGLTVRLIHVSDAFAAQKPLEKLIEGAGLPNPSYEKVVVSFSQHINYQSVKDPKALDTLMTDKFIDFYQQLGSLHHKIFPLKSNAPTRRLSLPFFIFRGAQASPREEKKPQLTRCRALSGA